MSEIQDQIVQVRERCIELLDTAEESICGGLVDSKILLCNASDEWAEYRIIGMGRETWRKFLLFGRKTTYTYFYLRNDYYYHYSSGAKKYSNSVAYGRTKQSIVEMLEKSGNWGKFLNDNKGLIDAIRQTCVEGKGPTPGFDISF